MNDNDICSVDFTRSLPPPLKDNPEINAMGRVIAEQLQITARKIRQNIIYARIDELDEQTLDILAYDLHVDWYDYTHPITAKRAVIKDSVRVHKRLGTLYAVRTALGSVYPESEIEEWFDYGGEHHTFRVVLDVTNSRAPADYSSIKRAVRSYKRISAQMESMIYQCRIDVQILTDWDKYQHLAGYSGKRLVGTYPQRNTLAALTDAGVVVMPDGGGTRFTNPAAGTKPQREVVAALRESVIQASGEGVQFPFGATATGKSWAGERPGRSTAGAVQRTQIVAGVAVDAYPYASPETGVQPHRSTTTVGKRGGIIPEVTGVAYTYRVKRCGTDRCKDR